MQTFSKIGLIGRQNNPQVAESLGLLVDYLLARKDIEVTLESSISALVDRPELRSCEREDLDQFCDLVIVVGGDGSMLKAAPMLADRNIPVVGINRGRLGFLTDIVPDEIEPRIEQVLNGEFKLEPRFLLEVTTEHKGRKQPAGSALNDVVLHPGVAAQMIEFKLYIDDEFVYNQASDGLIVATPTGSTAYSMSAGGPIMHPRLDALVLVPMYPHTLSSRPVVIGANCEITIVIGDRHSIMPQVSCDGSVATTTAPGDRITIRKYRNALQLIHPVDYNYYETCRSKLGWSSRLGKTS